MDLFALAERGWWLTLPVAVLVGVVLGASPLGWPAAVTGLSVATASDRDARPAWPTLGAIGVGITAVYAVLGLFVGGLDELLRSGFGAWGGPLYAGLALAAAVAGVVLIRRPAVVCHARLQRPRIGRASDVALGALLSAVSCPACAGIITGVALAGAAAGGVAVATVAMIGLGVGQTLTLLVLGRVVRSWRGLTSSALVLQRAAGATLVLTGAWFAWQAWASGLDVATTLP